MSQPYTQVTTVQPPVAQTTTTNVAKKKSSSTWLYIVIAIIVIFLIVALIWWFTRSPAVVVSPGTTPGVGTPLFRVQTSSVTSGADTISQGGNTAYIGTPAAGASVSLSVPASTLNVSGTMLTVKNLGAGTITLFPQAGVSISPANSSVGAGQYAQFLAVAANSYVRLQ